MGETTNIEWCHHTHNEWIGCSKVHAGCTNCYAEALTKRYGWTEWGDNGVRKVTSEANRRKPLAWARAAAKAGERRRVFCSSLADVLDERAPADAQAHLWDTIRQTAAVNSHGQGPLVRRPRHPSELRSPGLDWLLLTKRPERWEIIPEDVRPLVWLGTSISDQKTADEWVPRLLHARGFAKRFLSVEPLIGPVDLRFGVDLGDEDSAVGCVPCGVGGSWHEHPMVESRCSRAIDWVIVGGESGPKARPCDIAWIRSIVQQCRDAGVPAFVKQLGERSIERAPAEGRTKGVEYALANLGDGHPQDAWFKREGWTLVHHGGTSEWIKYHRHADKKGDDPAEWPADLRVREFPRG